ncbi:MAG: prepilin-type N-terminal cleavage/methylation domain-containing protein [Planctomycetota bacterium]
MRPTPSAVRSCRAGFSLIELLVVITIIGVVISIIVPAIGAARDAARTQSSQNLLSQVTAAAETFRLDRRRYPGYFSNTLMGSDDNGGSGGLPGTLSGMRGLSAAENVMLDLASSDAIFSDDDASRVAVGPTSTGVTFGGGAVNQTEIFVNPGLVGSGSNTYFVPSGEFYVAQTTLGSSDPFGGGTKQVAENRTGHTGEPGELQLPDLVDAFGTPVLIWSANTDGVPNITGAPQFGARELEPGDAVGPRLFSWNSNAAFLRANSLGEGEVNMNISPFDESRRPASLIGAGAVAELDSGDDSIGRMLALFLGSPSFPNEEVLRDTSADYFEFLFPNRARGDFIVHSAGADGIYFSARDRAVRSFMGGNAFSPSTGVYDPAYSINFAPSSGAAGERRTDENGKPTNIDFAGEFDDLIVSTN